MGRTLQTVQLGFDYSDRRAMWFVFSETFFEYRILVFSQAGDKWHEPFEMLDSRTSHSPQGAAGY